MQQTQAEAGQDALAARMGRATFERAPYVILTALAFLMPVFFIPGSLVSFAFAKTFLLAVGVIAAFIAWVLGRLREGYVEVPRTWIIMSVAGLIVAYFLSSLFSDSVSTSFIGQGFEIGTFSTIALLGVLIVLASISFVSKQSIFFAYLAFFASFVVVVLYQIIRLLFGADALTFGQFTSSVGNFVGKWSDLGAYFGLVAVLAITTLEFLNVSRLFKALLYVALVVSLFFIALANFYALWVIVGLFAFVLLVYLLSFNPLPVSGEEGFRDTDPATRGAPASGRRKISGVAIFVIIVMLVLLISGGTIGNLLADTFGVSQLEARPSWTSTLEVTEKILKSNPLLGIGPNRFSSGWLMHKPEGINETVFWNVDFNSGIGFVPTAPATVGLAGIIAWIAFLALFGYAGFRAIFARVYDGFAHYLVVSSFLAALFLWIFSFFYVPNIAMLALAALFTGLFIASLVAEHILPLQQIRFSSHPAVNFVSVLFSVLLIILSVVGGYLITQRFLSSILFQKSLVAFNVDGNVEGAQTNLSRAISLYQNDLYFRALSELQIAKINSILSKPDLSEDAVRSQFQQALAEGIQNGRNATEVNPTNYQNWLALGRVYEAIVPLAIEGAYDNAKQAYDRALTLNPRSPAIHLSFARLELAAGNISSAREAIGKALAEKPNYTEAIFLLSQIEINEGNVQEAIASVESAALLSPNDPAILFQLGILKYNVEDFAGAASALEGAVVLNSSYANAMYFLGLSYDMLDRSEAAIEQFERVAELNPGNAEVQLILTNLREGRGPFDNQVPPLEPPEERSTLPIQE